MMLPETTTAQFLENRNAQKMATTVHNSQLKNIKNIIAQKFFSCFSSYNFFQID
jgi:hypothetical protein